MFSRHQGLTGSCIVLAAAMCWVFFHPRDRTPASVANEETPELAGNQEVPAAAPLQESPRLIKHKEEEVFTPLPEDFLKRILSADEKTVTITLPDGGTVKGKVSSVRRDAAGPLLIQGTITDPEAGRFMFQRQTVPGVAGAMVGFILYDKSETAWQVRPVGANGKPALVKTTADRVICRAYPAPEGPEEIPPTHPTNYPIPPDENGVIQLQSLPGAVGVVYLDFDGEERNFDSWGYFNAQPAPATNAQIYEVWKGVSEDFHAFNLNVTTVRAAYDSASEGRRIQVVVTPTSAPSPGSGGVAYVGSFNWAGEMVCWSFYSTGKNAVEVISHEVGHTLGLVHQGTNSSAYYLGHTGWAPIMGAGYYETPSQWSKGEYPDAKASTASGLQDDLNIIATANNNVEYRADDHGDTYAAATWLELTAAGTVSNEGNIETSADEDSFRFTTSGGTVNLQIHNVEAFPNLDIKAEILDSSGTPVASHDPSDSLDAQFSGLDLTAGGYILRVSGVGKGNLVTGYSDYASLGSFTVTGTISGGVHPDAFTVAENSPIDTAVGIVLPRADHGGGSLIYSVASGNTGGTFAIDPSTGALTISNSELLDFETLSTSWDDPATFELFISITDSLGSASETIRTVVSVGDVNEPPSFPAPPAVTMAEHLRPGTLVTTVAATDPDRSDHVTYSIIDGNTGGAFAIDPATGEITVTGVLHYETSTSFTLTLRATDNLSPANSADASLTIDLMDISEDYAPGTIIRTFFKGISGSSVASLGNSANFPNKPHQEAVLTSFDSGTSAGDSYGSTVRGYVIAPATGNYTFWISSDNAGELRISPDANPANAVVRASVTGATDPGEWDSFPSQQSTDVALTAGQVYYIEARQKDDIEGDHVQVAWEGPGVPDRGIIPGRWLAPYDQDYAPWAADQTLVVRESANNGQRVGGVSFTEPDLGQAVSSYAITAGNNEEIFAINSFTGDITVADGIWLVAGETHVLTVSATDNGAVPMEGFMTVTIHVLGLDEQLHAWWKLDESSGTTVNDSSGNSRQANLIGGGSWIVRDAANRALQLNGANARFTYTGNNALAGGTSFSAAAWVKVPTSHASDGMLIQQQKSGISGHIGRYLVYVKADGRVNFSVYGKDANGANEAYQFDITSTTSIDDGTWHHVACVRDGNNGRVFIDGVQSASGSGPVRMLDSTLTVAVGYDARNNNSFLNAAVDDVRILGDALGSQQIVRIAGTPKVAITSPVGAAADIPAGVGLMLAAAASDPDGPPPSIEWTAVSGPGTVAFGTPANAETTALFSTSGSYVLRVTASDGVNSTGADITVFAGLTASSPFGGTTYGGGPPGSHFGSGPASHTLIGTSSGINGGGTSDGFYLLGQAFAGDFDVRARVASMANVAGTTDERAGLVLRLGTSGTADEIGAFIGFGGNGAGHWIRRPVAGAPNLPNEYPGMPVPGWCRIRRSDGIIEFQHSDDGVVWTLRGVTILNDEVRVGLGWSSGHASNSGSAVFNNVSGFSVSNIGPHVHAGPDATAYANIAADLEGSFNDDGLPTPPAAASTTWSKVSGPGSVVFGNASQTETTASCSAEGEYVLRLVADDGAVRTFDEVSLSAELLDTIEVAATDANAAETGPDTGTFTLTRGGSLIGEMIVAFDLTGTASNGVDYTSDPLAITIPAGVQTATITVTPLADSLVEGQETVNLTIIPGAYEILDDAAEVVIADSNHAPGWASPVISGADGVENATYSNPSLATFASDPDGTPVTFSLTGGPAWLTVAANGSLSGTPGAGDVGPNTFNVRVTDPGGLFADAVFEILVHFNNLQPVFTADPVIAADAVAQVPYAGQSLAAFATDPNLIQGDVLSFTKLGGPGWLEVDSNGDLTGTPQVSDIGSNMFGVRVSDALGATADITLQIVVTETILYLDTNGADPGSGAPASVAWDSSAVWTADMGGAAGTLPWIAGAKAVLSAGADAVASSITVDGSQLIGGLIVEEGAPVLTGGSLVLTGPSVGIATSTTVEIASELTGSGMGFVKSGFGTLVLSGNNTFTGDLGIHGGILELAGAGKLYNSGPVTTAVITIGSGGTWRLPDFSYAGAGQLAEDRARRVMDGGVIDVTGASHSSGQNFTVTANGGTFRQSAAGQVLTLQGNVTDNILVDGLLTFDSAGEIIVSEALEGVGSLAKTGAGVVELSAANTLSGAVTIINGAVRLSGSLPAISGVWVESNGTLTGNGSIANGVTVSGTLAPGNGVGSINTGALVLNTGAIMQWQANDWIGAAGSGYDVISAASLDFTSATSVIVVLAAESLANFTDAAATFTLVQTVSGITGFDVGKFTIDAGSFPQATGHWTPRVGGNDLLLDYTPLTPFEVWQLAEFGVDAGNILVAGDPADPDHDSLTNLMEFALGTDPNLSNVTTVVMDTVNVSGTAYLRLTITKNPAASDVTFVVQTTGDLADPDSWSNADTIVESDTPGELIVRDALAGPSRFIRLRVTR